MKARTFACSMLVILCSLPYLLPSGQAQEQAQFKKIATIEGITEYRLDNGMRVVLFPDPSSAKVTVNMTIFVGSRHEGYGETGMAHLLEHMVFKGCKDFPDPWKALQDRGASFNGSTWVDRTNYYETMAATDDNLEFGIKLEADRLVTSFIKREDLAKEMTVVRNEFEQGENQPYSILYQRMLAVAFEWHNYGKSTIGNRSDIERVPIENLQAFYKKFYRPDNAMLVVAGKFDEAKAKEYIAKYVAPLKNPPGKADLTYTEEPAQDGERNVILRRVGKVALVGSLYHIPAAAHDDAAALEILSRVLGDTPSGRLYKALVETKKATQVFTDATAWHDPGVLEAFAVVGDKSTPEEVRDILVEVVENLQKNPVKQEEVDRAKQKYKAARESALSKSQTIAIELSEWAGAGDWRLLFIHRDKVAKVTPEDVMRVAEKYLKQTNRTVGMFIPTKDVVRTQIPTAPAVADLVKDYKGGDAQAAGEAFDPTPENIEKRVKRFTLPSGIKVALLQKKTRGEAVVGRVTLHFGNEKSLVSETTACDFLGSLMMRGTKKYSREEIQDILAKISSKLNGSSDTATLNFSLESKRQHLPALLDLLHEVLREPTFPEKEFTNLKNTQKQSLDEALTDPQSLASRALRRHLHPYPKDDIRYQPTIPESLERLEKVTASQVGQLYHEQVGGEVGELVLIGDFDDDVEKRLPALFQGWKAKTVYERIPEPANTKVAGLRENILTPDKEGAIYIAGHLMALTDESPDYPALSLGNYMLGGSSTSRLFDRLRQKEGLSYGAGSFVSVESRDLYGSFTMYGICNPENIEKVDKVAGEELELALKKGFSADELARAQKAFLQEQKVRRGSDSTIASVLREGLHLGRTYQRQADLEKKIAALTAEEVNQALARYLSSSRLVIVRAGDFNKKGSPEKKK